MRDGSWQGIVVAVVMVLGGGQGFTYENDSDPATTTMGSGASLTDTATPASGEESEAKSQLRVSMEFQNAQLKDVLKAFSQQTGINVIARSDISNATITLYLEDVTVMDALDQILRVGNLEYERPAGSDIYIVRPKQDESAKQGKPVEPMTRVYKLKYARVSKSILAKTATSFGSRTPFEATLQAQGGGGGGGGGGDVGIDIVIGKLLTDHGAVVVDERTNSLIITDVPENFPRLEAALAALDVRTSQIMVDAELIETSLTKAKDFGIKWGTGTSGQLITFTPTSRQTRFPFNMFKEGIQPGVQDNTKSVKTPFVASTLDASSFKAVLEAIEADGDTKILARPKVLTLDNESAVVRLTTDEAIGFTTSNQATTGTQTQTPERTTTGVVLVVTPQINDNSDITMMVEPSVTKTVTSNLTPPSGQSKPKDPKTRSSRTMVRIRSGDTLVVGGLIDRSEQETRTTVPVLSGIPVIGEAFKHSDISNSSSELLVFITPRILDEPVPQLAGTSHTSMGLREQEPSGARQDVIEQALNVHEQPR
ncbi:MAG: hypothetical protein HY352_05855 [Candidatus Omnitrophica bacterium]|nr:hypothetical protein [Candidatus Omnitrophota bacterium]